jgi:hypothetical protein
MAQMGFLSIRAGVTYNMKDFLNHQENRLKEIYARFRTFEAMVIEMTLAACRSHLIDIGFSPDDYPQEMEYYMKGLESMSYIIYKHVDKIGTYKFLNGPFLSSRG